MVEQHGRGKVRQAWVRAGAVVLAAGAAIVMAVPAHAVTVRPRPIASGQHGPAVHTDGFESGSVITRGRCKGWVNTLKVSGHWYAQGLAESWDDTYYCNMKLQIRHGSGSYQKVSKTYQADGDKVHTGYHRDDSGYKARVCIWGKNDIGWHCGGGV